VLVLSTLGAPERRLLGGRRGKRVERVEPEPVPTSRATIVRAQPFESGEQAGAWLADVQGERGRVDAEVDDAVRDLNTAIRAHRAAAADTYAREVSAEQALAVRIGYGDGDEVADGRFTEAWEPPQSRGRTRRSMESREERFAALLGARETALAGEELVLRARADLEAGRPREAALQARIALEALLAELPRGPNDRRAELEADRGQIGEAANAALRGVPGAELQEQVSASIARMEAALRRLRLKG
jgi:hypothetical protein